MDSELKSNSNSWVFFVKVSFAIALFAAAAGVVLAPVDIVIKGYMAISALFLVSTTITLSKTLRDEHEQQRITNRISEARTHQLLKEYGE
ncbi:hypothetical protein C7H09_14520 [Marinobacter fuscus]|uniref:YiaAB two helix domain-containing protein n=1 Tax=Marinobacter fuscus TaxID=2109942 RepID=A0A2T1K5S2_9GAMM|nr:YiaA/YiaB family inner membrane protein [Marinobacter fuscus]PSF05514.1 hypothetical protein C7H09_14520 [Marinobacter fuscus]